MEDDFGMSKVEQRSVLGALLVDLFHCRILLGDLPFSNKVSEFDKVLNKLSKDVREYKETL